MQIKLNFSNKEIPQSWILSPQRRKRLQKNKIPFFKKWFYFFSIFLSPTWGKDAWKADRGDYFPNNGGGANCIVGLYFIINV